jgi:choline transport protein
MLDSLDSLPLTLAGVLVFIFAFAFASATMLTTWGRVWWSFARENGVPFSSLQSRINDRWQLPVNATLVAFLACVLIGLLELGSQTALNAILGGSTLCIFTSYSIPVACLLMNNRRNFSTKHYFDLGRVFGLVLNTISFTWMTFVFVWLCFPLYLPVTLSTTNWASVVFFGILFLSTVNWFAHSRREFKVPVAIESVGVEM